MKCGTLFTGGDGFGIGARAAGLELAWGLEWDAAIAAHANRQLGNHVRVGDVTKADPAEFDYVDWLHASPPCTNASVANAEGQEVEADREMARAIVRFLEHLRPRFFSLENVFPYRKFESWTKIISPALHRLGYGYQVEHINAADFGVPQKRKRMIVRAVRDTFFAPAPMRPTHAKGGAGGLKPWVGWWDAVKDIAHTFPPSELAPWQKARLGNAIGKTLPLFSDLQQAGRDYTVREGDEPSTTVQVAFAYRPITNPKAILPPAILVRAGNPSKFNGADDLEGDSGLLESPEEPAPSARSGRSEIPRAILLGDDLPLEIQEEDEPRDTVTKKGNVGRVVLVDNPDSPEVIGLLAKAELIRTILIDPSNSHPDRGPIEADGDEPAWTLRAGQGEAKYRVVLVDQQTEGNGTDRELATHEEDEPSGTVKSGSGGRLQRVMFTEQTTKNSAGRRVKTVGEDEPADVVRSGEGGGRFNKALLVDGGNAQKEGPIESEDEEPARTVTGRRSHNPKAILVEGVSKGPRPPTTVDDDAPAFTIESGSGGRVPRAILGNGTRSEPQAEDEPTDTITGSSNQLGVKVVEDGRALLGNGSNSQPQPEGEPADTVVSNHRTLQTRMLESEPKARVVALTVRALARFQSFPDWYDLGDNKENPHFFFITKTLAVTIIGNAVPPDLAEQMIVQTVPPGELNP